MRNGLKIAFYLLICPAISMAQNSALPVPPSDPGEALTPTEEVVPATANTTVSPPAASVSEPLPGGAIARGVLGRPPVAAGYASAFSVTAGYSVARLWTPASAGATLVGVDTGISIDTGTHFGGELNFDYGSASSFLSSGHRLDQFSYLIGPTFRFSRTSPLNLHLHFLVGGARTAGPVPNPNGGFVTGYVNYPAWAAGGRFEYPFSKSWGIRVSVDYLRTYFLNSSINVRGQNGLRVANSIVYYFSAPSIRHRHRQ